MILIFLNVFGFWFSSVFSNVIELDSNFNEIINNGPWLVKFYAPWCGYCRKLEPIYNDFEIQVKNIPVKVGRIDATRYPEVASHYQIRGYPTIKYINGTDVFTHEGDRTVEHLILFTKRALGLAVKHLPSEGRFIETVESHLSETFFLHIGQRSGYLKAVYDDLANLLRLRSYFYSIEQHFIPQIYHSKLDLQFSLSDPENGTIIAWKHDKKISFYYFLSQIQVHHNKSIILSGNFENGHFNKKQSTDISFQLFIDRYSWVISRCLKSKTKVNDHINLLNSSLQNWIVLNQFSTFPKISQHDLWELEVLRKSVVIFLFNNSDVMDISSISEQDPRSDLPSIKLFKLAKLMASNSVNEADSDLYFVWSTDVSSMGDLAMIHLVVPNIFIFQPWNHTIYLHPDVQSFSKINTLDEKSVSNFLHSFRNGKIQGYGGTGFTAKLKRAGYDFVTGLIEFVSTTPILALFIIGVPLSVVSFLCYAICCMDTSEADYVKMGPRPIKKIRKPLYEVSLKSSEELNIKSENEKKND